MSGRSGQLRSVAVGNEWLRWQQTSHRCWSKDPVRLVEHCQTDHGEASQGSEEGACERRRASSWRSMGPTVRSRAQAALCELTRKVRDDQ